MKKVLSQRLKKLAPTTTTPQPRSGSTPKDPTAEGPQTRPAFSKDRFVHPKGTRPKAVIIDIDGTLQDWGSTTVSKGMEFAKRHYEADHVLVIVTARDHEYSFESSFNWLVAHLPYPFIGPIHRTCDDPRYASEFKREVAESLSTLYEVVGAADDNSYVLEMWHEYAKDHPGFEVCECSYTSYTSWRKDISRYGKGTYYGASRAVESLGTSDHVVDSRGGSHPTTTYFWPQDDEELTALADDRDGRITNRLDLEDEVYAEYPDLTWPDIQEMDIQVLKDLLADADEARQLEETAPLDVAEILDEMGEKPATTEEEVA